MTHLASCRCGQLSAVATGDPVRISVCHCLDCQKRSGSAFAAQVRFPIDAVTIAGAASVVAHTGGGGNIARFHFCPACGGTIAFINDAMPETIAIPLGAFADPYVFTPNVSVWEERQHEWLELAGEMQHYD
ncbi:MAG: GFA family protein [Sphingomicrobium sp.]